MSKFLFYFLFLSLNCNAPLNHWEMALNKFIIIILMIYGEMFSGMFNSGTIHSVQIKFNRPQGAKKVNCLNFIKFFQHFISLLEMISILFDSCHWFSPKF